MSNNRYRMIYGETHDTVHIKDDLTNRKFFGPLDTVTELNVLNDIISTLMVHIKADCKELVRINDDNNVKWLVTDYEDIKRYEGNADVKTYEEYIESIKK